MNTAHSEPVAKATDTKTPLDQAMASLSVHSPRILILSGDVDSNLGDRAILQSLYHELRNIRPDANIALVSSCGERLGIDATFIPRGVRGFVKLCKETARSDLVVCGGGGLFQDDDSLIKMPYWALRVLAARILCGRVVGYSLGVGPLGSLTSRIAARLAFAGMQSVSVRDPLAKETAQSVTDKPVSLVPDPALLLPTEQKQRVRIWLAEKGVPLGEQNLIGVAVRRWFPPGRRLLPHKIKSRLIPGEIKLSAGSKRLAALLAKVLDELIREHNARVLLMPSYGADHEGDGLMSREVMANMSEDKVHLLEIDSPALYKGITSEMRLFIGGRMHPSIFAAATGTPVVGVAYNPKFHGFYRMLGLDDQVMDVTDFVKDERVEALVTLASRTLQGPRVPREQIEPLEQCIRLYNRNLFGALF